MDTRTISPEADSSQQVMERDRKEVAPSADLPRRFFQGQKPRRCVFFRWDVARCEGGD
jgi:hypothetical protein